MTPDLGFLKHPDSFGQSEESVHHPLAMLGYLPTTISLSFGSSQPKEMPCKSKSGNASPPFTWFAFTSTIWTAGDNDLFR
jgi:hypothetical protein